jgi:hypothetical protein
MSNISEVLEENNAIQRPQRVGPWINASTELLSCYTSPSRILPYIPLLSSRHSVHMNAGGDNYIIIFTSNKHFGLTDIDQKGVKRNT